MRKHLLTSVLLTVLMLSGCSRMAAGAAPGLGSRSFAFTCTAGVDSPYSIEVERFSDESITLTYTSPESVEGMKLARNGSDIVCQYAGITDSFDYSRLPRTNPLRAFSSVFSASGGAARSDDGAWLCRTDGTAMSFDEKGIISITLNGEPMIVENFRFTD